MIRKDFPCKVCQMPFSAHDEIGRELHDLEEQDYICKVCILPFSEHDAKMRESHLLEDQE